MSYGDHFSDDDGNEQTSTDQVFAEQSSAQQPTNDQPTFINLVDSTSDSSDVEITHTSSVEENNITKKFWERLAGIYILNLTIPNAKPSHFKLFVCFQPKYKSCVTIFRTECPSQRRSPRNH